jgi:hypothetical protein
MYGRDPRVLKPSHDPGLSQEAPGELGVPEVIPEHGLEDEITVQTAVVDPPDLPHATFGEEATVIVANPWIAFEVAEDGRGALQWRTRDSQQRGQKGTGSNQHTPP